MKSCSFVTLTAEYFVIFDAVASGIVNFQVIDTRENRVGFFALRSCVLWSSWDNLARPFWSLLFVRVFSFCRILRIFRVQDQGICKCFISSFQSL